MPKIRTTLMTVAAASQTALGAPINVPGDQPTIQAALSVAVAGDEIILAPGVYDISAGLTFPASGVTLRSASGDPTDTALDANGGSSRISFGSRTAMLFQDLTITDGDQPVSITTSEVEFRNCRIVSNVSNGSAGALRAVACDLTFRDCLFEDNSQLTATAGAALAVFGGSLTVTGSTFKNNTAPQGDPLVEISQGSAILAGVGAPAGQPFEGTTIVIVDSVFQANVADNGGAISTLGADMTIDRCSFLSNTGSFGGAIFTRDFPVAGGPVLVGLLQLTNSVFNANDASRLGSFNGFGAAIATGTENEIKIINNTFYANTAEVARTIHLSNLTTGAISNNVFADSANPAFGGAFPTAHNNFSGSTAGAGLADADGADNVAGTVDDDVRLLPGSPLIDAGYNPDVPSGISFDYDGLDRFVDDPATPDTGVGDVLPIVDIGAHEFQPSTGPCNPADLAEPFGQLDFSDVVAFLTAFGAMDHAADLAPPFGQWDFSDVVAFLSAFGAGCP